MTPQPRRRRTGGKSALLEHCVSSLGALGFHEYGSNGLRRLTGSKQRRRAS